MRVAAALRVISFLCLCVFRKEFVVVGEIKREFVCFERETCNCECVLTNFILIYASIINLFLSLFLFLQYSLVYVIYVQIPTHDGFPQLIDEHREWLQDRAYEHLRE